MIGKKQNFIPRGTGRDKYDDDYLTKVRRENRRFDAWLAKMGVNYAT